MRQAQAVEYRNFGTAPVDRKYVRHTAKSAGNRNKSLSAAAKGSKRTDPIAAITVSSLIPKNIAAMRIACICGWMDNIDVPGVIQAGDYIDLLINLVDYLNLKTTARKQLKKILWTSKTPPWKVLGHVIENFGRYLPYKVQFEIERRITGFSIYEHELASSKNEGLDGLYRFSIHWLPSIEKSHPKLHDLILHCIALLMANNGVLLWDYWIDWFLECFGQNLDELQAEIQDFKKDGDADELKDLIERKDEYQKLISIYDEDGIANQYMKKICGYEAELKRFSKNLMKWRPKGRLESDWKTWMLKALPIIESGFSIGSITNYGDDDYYNEGLPPEVLVHICWNGNDSFSDFYVESIDNEVNNCGFRPFKATENNQVKSFADLVPTNMVLLLDLMDEAEEMIEKHGKKGALL